MKESDFWWLVVIILVIILPFVLYYSFISDTNIKAEENSTLGVILDKENGIFSNKKIENEDLDINYVLPKNSSLINFAKFQRSFKPVKGYAILFNFNNTNNLMFYNFSIDSMSDVYIYLSSSSIADDFIELGKLKGKNGNFTYIINESIDLNKYNKVLIWFRPFGILYAKAEFN